MKVKIEIDTQTFVRFWLVVIGFALAILMIYSARTALIIIGVSFFLALALSPPVNRLVKLLPSKSRIGATALAYVAVTAVLGGFMFLVVPPIVEQTAKFAQTVPEIVDDATGQWGGLNATIDRYGIRDQVDQALASIRENASGLASNLGATIVSGAGSLVSLLVASLLVFVLAFLMLVEGPAWVKRLWKVYDDQERMERHRDIASRMYNVVTSYVNGQLLVALIAGASSGLVVFILSFFFNLPANLSMPIAAIVFVGGLIPMFGATIGGIIAGLLLGFNDVTAAIIFLIYFVVYQQVENNVISPAVQSKALDLSALTILISVTIGLYLFGIAGGIISIPIAGCINVLLDDYFANAKKKRVKSDKPLAKLARKIHNENA